MSFFVFRSAGSNGARELADALGGSRLRKFADGRLYRSRTGVHPATIRQGDVVVNWGGSPIIVPAGVKVLNNVAINSKYTDAEKLKAAGVATVEVSRNRPNRQAAAPVVDPALVPFKEAQDGLEDFLEAELVRTPVFQQGIQQLITRLQVLNDALRRPIPQAAAVPDALWVGRVNDHTGGTDLLTPPPTPDYWVKKLDIVEEYRVHSFCEKSIRAGIKRHRAGFANPNPWIRSYDGGWSISYDNFKSTKAMRELAHKAVKALGLDFGAVDIGKLRDGSLIVLEVNRAPGLESGTTVSYQTSIERWSAGQWPPVQQPRQGRRAA